ncbi:MAG: NAD(+) kinase, partial [Flavobacteriaceae bacterium]|nr:NAD(+) kinase [Flavobacteriaceae bacterium]
MKIGIYGQFYHKDSEIYIQYILDALQSKNVEIVVEEAFLKNIKKNKDISKNYSKIFSFKEI